MEFQKWTREQYRSASDLDARRSAIREELLNTESKVATADLKAEMDMLTDEEQRRSMADAMGAAQQRSSSAAAVAAGAGTPVTGMQAIGAAQQRGFQVVRSEDPFDTEEYNRAFMEYTCRGKEYPAGLVQPGMRPANVRADAFTQTTDVPHFIPTTLSNQIISKMSEYGTIYPEVTKLSVQGGLEISIWDYLPTASWVTEAKPSDTQKATDATRISFLYYMLECKVAQSFLAQATTLDMFQRQYPEKVAEAMVRALEQAIMNGSGTGQPLGILKDTRVTADHKVTFAEADIAKWGGWATILSKLPASYRRLGKFYMSQGTWDTYIDGMVDTTGQPIARVNYGMDGANDTAYRFMGKQVKIVPEDILPNYDDAKGGAADTPCIVFGDMSKYIVNQQAGMRSVKWLDEDKNLTKMKMQTIVDGKLGDVNGLLVINAPKKNG